MENTTTSKHTTSTSTIKYVTVITEWDEAIWSCKISSVNSDAPLRVGSEGRVQERNFEKVKELMSKIQEGEAKKVGYITIQIFLMIANGERYFCSLIPSTREN